MVPRDIDPKETHARPVFRVLGVLLFLGMAAAMGVVLVAWLILRPRKG